MFNQRNYVWIVFLYGSPIFYLAHLKLAVTGPNDIPGIFTTRKRSLQRLCFHRCLSVHREGVSLSRWGFSGRPPYGKERAVSILLQCILVVQSSALRCLDTIWHNNWYFCTIYYNAFSAWNDVHFPSVSVKNHTFSCKLAAFFFSEFKKYIYYIPICEQIEGCSRVTEFSPSPKFGLNNIFLLENSISVQMGPQPIQPDEWTIIYYRTEIIVGNIALNSVACERPLNHQTFHQPPVSTQRDFHFWNDFTKHVFPSVPVLQET